MTHEKRHKSNGVAVLSGEAVKLGGMSKERKPDQGMVRGPLLPCLFDLRGCLFKAACMCKWSIFAPPITAFTLAYHAIHRKVSRLWWNKSLLCTNFILVCVTEVASKQDLQADAQLSIGQLFN